MNKLKPVLYLLNFLILVSISSAQTPTYVGPEKCLSCHNNASLGDMTGWRTSMHANGYSVVLTDDSSMVNLHGIIADYDANGIDDFKDGLDFNDISTVFDPFKPNAPILAYDATNGYTITIGGVTGRVYLTYGGSGHYKQRFAMKITAADGVTKDHYISPIQYNEKTDEYVLYHASDYWVYDNGTPTNTPVFTADSTIAQIAANNSRSLTKGCSGCHVTGLTVNAKDANGEWTMSGGELDAATLASYTSPNVYDLDGDGNLEQLNTTCERCHGPGSDHVASPSAATIINPADTSDMSANEANNLCGQCHSRGHSLPNGTFSFPYDDAAMIAPKPKDMVADMYSDGGGYWGDGLVGTNEKQSSKKHHQQFFDFYESSKPFFSFHNVTCFECHDVHNEVKHHIRAEMVEEDASGADIIIATDNDDNTLCLSCHATHGEFEALDVEFIADPVTYADTIATVVSLHTNHPYDPVATGRSRCSKCHMPKVIKSAVRYDIHAHTFEPISPQKTKEYGMPSSCAVSCHRGIENGGTPVFNVGVDATLSDWTESTDIALADSLLSYFGPTGAWWQVDQILAVVQYADNSLPDSYKLQQNYPNPFNPETTIKFNIIESGIVNLRVYNIMGQQVSKTLLNDQFQPGSYEVSLNASGLPSGVYLYRLEVNGFTSTKKMTLLK